MQNGILFEQQAGKGKIQIQRATNNELFIWYLPMSKNGTGKLAMLSVAEFKRIANSL